MNAGVWVGSCAVWRVTSSPDSHCCECECECECERERDCECERARETDCE